MEQNRVTGKAVIQPSEQRSEREILELIEEYKKSEFSVKDFCEVSDLNETTFYSWIKKYGSKKKDDVSGFAKIEVIPTLTSSKRELFAEVGIIKLYKEVSAAYLKALIS